MVANIDPIESFILGVEVKIEALGIDDGRHDCGVSFPGKDSAGDVVLGIGESSLSHQGFEADGRECIRRGSFFPNFNSLSDNNFILGCTSLMTIQLPTSLAILPDFLFQLSGLAFATIPTTVTKVCFLSS